MKVKEWKTAAWVGAENFADLLKEMDAYFGEKFDPSLLHKRHRKFYGKGPVSARMKGKEPVIGWIAVSTGWKPMFLLLESPTFRWSTTVLDEKWTLASARKVKRPQLAKGDKVMVYNHTLGGKQITEGTATLVERMMLDKFSGNQMWNVRFDDGDELVRWVRPEDRVQP